MPFTLFSTKLLPVELPTMTLEEAAARLGVHYMTVYRYVRTGRLPAEWRDGRWHVRPVDLEPLERPGTSGGAVRRARRTRPSSLAGATERMLDRLLAGDAAGAWLVAESALLAGRPQDVYLQILAPCLKLIGDGWESGRINVADEHRATAVAMGLVGRLGPMFARRGRRRAGAVLLAGAEGDPHAIPVLMVGDFLRSEGINVIQLGADVPADSLVAMAGQAELIAVGLSAATDAAVTSAARAAAELHARLPGLPVMLGGPAVPSEETARAAGADAWAADAASAVDVVAHLFEQGDAE